MTAARARAVRGGRRIFESTVISAAMLMMAVGIIAETLPLRAKAQTASPSQPTVPQTTPANPDQQLPAPGGYPYWYPHTYYYYPYYWNSAYAYPWGWGYPWAWTWPAGVSVAFAGCWNCGFHRGFFHRPFFAGRPFFLHHPVFVHHPFFFHPGFGRFGFVHPGFGGFHGGGRR